MNKYPNLASQFETVEDFEKTLSIIPEDLREAYEAQVRVKSALTPSANSVLQKEIVVSLTSHDIQTICHVLHVFGNGSYQGIVDKLKKR